MSIVHPLIGSYIRFIRSCVCVHKHLHAAEGKSTHPGKPRSLPVRPTRGTCCRPFHIFRLLYAVWTASQHPIRRSLSRLLNSNDESILSDRMILLPMLLLPMLLLLLLLPLLLPLLLLMFCWCLADVVGNNSLSTAAASSSVALLSPMLPCCCYICPQQSVAAAPGASARCCYCCCPRCFVSSTLDSTIVSSAAAAQHLKPQYSTTRF